jgi:hypothetical protein
MFQIPGKDGDRKVGEVTVLGLYKVNVSAV